MEAVVIVALAAWSCKMLSNSVRYSERARQYEWMYRNYMVRGPQPWPSELPVPSNPRDRWAVEMSQKYRHAAGFPWMSVEADRPPPD